MDEGEQPVRLSNIFTGVSPSPKATSLILQARELGRKSFKEFVDKQLIGNELEFLAPITGLKTPSLRVKGSKSIT